MFFEKTAVGNIEKRFKSGISGRKIRIIQYIIHIQRDNRKNMEIIKSVYFWFRSEYKINIYIHIICICFFFTNRLVTFWVESVTVGFRSFEHRLNAVKTIAEKRHTYYNNMYLHIIFNFPI